MIRTNNEYWAVLKGGALMLLDKPPALNAEPMLCLKMVLPSISVSQKGKSFQIVAPEGEAIIATRFNERNEQSEDVPTPFSETHCATTTVTGNQLISPFPWNRSTFASMKNTRSRLNLKRWLLSGLWPCWMSLESKNEQRTTSWRQQMASALKCPTVSTVRQNKRMTCVSPATHDTAPPFFAAPRC
jgi:antitoxin component HigA of HigAB toxin-antitoxin module